MEIKVECFFLYRIDNLTLYKHNILVNMRFHFIAFFFSFGRFKLKSKQYHLDNIKIFSKLKILFKSIVLFYFIFSISFPNFLVSRWNKNNNGIKYKYEDSFLTVSIMTMGIRNVRSKIFIHLTKGLWKKE